MRRVLWVALALALDACEGTKTVFVPLPPASKDARSMIVAAETDHYRALAATDLDRPVVKLPVRELGQARITALVYAGSLEDIGVPLGALREAEPSAPGFLLPRPTEIWLSSYLGGKSGDWAELTDVPVPIKAVRIAGMMKNPCLSFREDVHPLGPSNGSIAVPLDDTSALVATEDGEFWKVDSQGAVPFTKLSSSTPHLSVYRAGKGDLWIAGENGGLVHGDPDASLMREPASALKLHFQWLAGEGAGDSADLFAVSGEGSFEHFSGGSWSVLRGADPRGWDWRRAVAIVGPKQALAAGVTGATVLRYDAGALNEEPVEASAPLTSVALIPGFGEVLGTLDGAIFHKQAGAWIKLDMSPLSLPVMQLVPFRDGFLATGGGGILTEYYPGFGFCAPISTAHTIVKHVAVLSTGVVLLGDRPSGSSENNTVSFLVPL